MKTEKHSANSSGPSRETIEQYLRGELSPQEMHRVERMLEDDAFSYEAVEGLEKHPKALQQLEEITENYHSQHSGSWFDIFSWKHLLIPLGAVLIVGSFWWQKQTSELQPVMEQEKQEILAEKTSTPNIEQITITPNEPEINTREKEGKRPKESNIRLKTKKTEKKTYQKQLKSQPSTVIIENPDNMPELAHISYRRIVSPYKSEPIKRAVSMDIPYEIFVIEGLDVVNLFYHNLYSNPDDLGNIGTDPSLSDTGTMIPGHIGTKNYVYGDFMQIALAQYKDKQYTKAIENLNIILEQYPKDVNAEYYIGLAYYRQNKAEKAIHFLGLAANNAIAYFKDDANLYKALSYKKKGDLDTCKKLLNELVTQNAANKSVVEEILNHQFE